MYAVILEKKHKVYSEKNIVWHKQKKKLIFHMTLNDFLIGH